jgi:hypothetical protein
VDGTSENARAVRPRRWDKEWWTSRAYECRDKRAVAGRAAAEVAAHYYSAVRSGSVGEPVRGRPNLGEDVALEVQG